MAKYAALGDALPFWHLEEDGTMVYGDGSLGCGFRLEGHDIGCATEERINDIADKIEHLVCSIPEGWRLQLYYRLSPSGGGILDAHGDVSRNAPEKYAPLRKSRLGFLKGIEEGEGFFNPEIFLFLRGVPHAFARRKLWQGGGAFGRLTEEGFAEHKKNFLKGKKKIKAALGYGGFNPGGIGADGWFSLLFGHFNPERTEKLAPCALRDGTFAGSLASQTTMTDLAVHGDCLRLGSRFFGALTLSALPEDETEAGQAERLLKAIPCHFWLSQTVEVGDQKKEIDGLRLRRRLANSMARGARNMSDLESESQLRHTEELLAELIEGGQKVVAADTTVIVWGDSKEELDERRDDVLRAFQEMGKSEGIVETLPLFDVFISAAPGTCDGFRKKKMKSSNCAHLMPVYTGWKGNTRPVCLFENRDGGLVGLDPFAPELPSWNGLIFAASGSGKSFSVLQLAAQFYGQDPTPRIVWIDNGGSSERLLDGSVLDGQFIDLSLGSPVRLNMFDLPTGEGVPGPGKVKLILAVLERILRDEGQRGLPKGHKAVIEEAIYGVYENAGGKTPVLGDLKKILDGHELEEMRGYGRMLFPWTGGRAYGRLLDGRTNADLDKDLISFETGGLDAHPDLQNAMLLIITDFIRTAAEGDTSRPTLLVVDEAWKLFETPSGQSFATEAYRTFRKFGCGIWCISQNYRDFLKNDEIANALLPNTSSILVLSQSKIDWEDFKKRLQFNDAETEAVKSLRSVKGQYAEAFLAQGENRTVLRIEADPLSYYVATSDPKDKNDIVRAQARKPSAPKLEILRDLAKAKGGL